MLWMYQQKHTDISVIFFKVSVQRCGLFALKPNCSPDVGKCSGNIKRIHHSRALLKDGTREKWQCLYQSWGQEQEQFLREYKKIHFSQRTGAFKHMLPTVMAVLPSNSSGLQLHSDSSGMVLSRPTTCSCISLCWAPMQQDHIDLSSELCQVQSLTHLVHTLIVAMLNSSRH